MRPVSKLEVTFCDVLDTLAFVGMVVLGIALLWLAAGGPMPGLR